MVTATVTDSGSTLHIFLSFTRICGGIGLADAYVMRKTVIGPGLLLACAATLWSCSGSALPASPSSLTSLTAPGAGGARLRTLDDPPMPPAPDPKTPPTPMQVIIGIIGTVGSGAFLPNPIQANMGDMIVWQNNDTRTHHIVLDDGITDLGEVMPGQSSAPMALTTPMANFHCTIHPTMIGSINGVVGPDPYMPPPQDDYGGGYGYYGYY
jgi:hypothetical protein